MVKRVFSLSCSFLYDILCIVKNKSILLIKLLYVTVIYTFVGEMPVASKLVLTEPVPTFGLFNIREVCAFFSA
jgi:hypothetical protein